MKCRLIATTTMGLESVLGKECRSLGFENIAVSDGKVEFDGDLTDVCKANLWLRTAGRIYIKLITFKALTFDELFDQTYAFEWERWIPKDGQFPVTKVSSRKSKLFSKSDCQAIVKKAVAKRLENQYGQRCQEEGDSIVAIRIQIENDAVVLSIDSSGAGLNKRGYRAHNAEASLRETLAAGMILISRWRSQKDYLLDPFCGTGTILIEAAMIAENRAPGLIRRFISENWPIIPKKLWANEREAAIASIKTDGGYHIFGSDHNSRVIETAKQNANLAGIKSISFKHCDVSQINSPNDFGKIISNPPYGYRLNEQTDIETLYKDIGTQFRTHFFDWTYYFLTAHESFESLFGAKSRKHRKLYNGGIKCFYYQYFNY